MQIFIFWFEIFELFGFFNFIIFLFLNLLEFEIFKLWILCYLTSPLALSEKYIQFDIQHLYVTKKINILGLFLMEEDLESSRSKKDVLIYMSKKVGDQECSW